MKLLPILLLVLSGFIYTNVNAQFATRKVSKKEAAYTDSLKQVNYDYLFPFLGQKTYKAGFDIPYPIGIMGNFIWMRQGILIDNIQLGIKTDTKDIPLTDVSEFIKFGDNSNTSYTVNVRPDIWIFPFLNVYGLFGVGRSETTVKLTSPIEFTSVVDQQIQTMGVGMMGAFGIGPLWVSLDGNWTWNKPELLDKPVNVAVFGARIGHTFVFDQHPDRNFAIWGGAMRVRMESNTVGQIQMIDAIPPEVWDKKDQFIAEYNTWYDGLTPAKKALVDATPIPDVIERLDARDGSSIIKYGMDKQVFQEWNGIVGAQFQYNKRWMLRTEWGIIGDRKSALASLNYRFLL
jgi:hypothetical protein